MNFDKIQPNLVIFLLVLSTVSLVGWLVYIYFQKRKERRLKNYLNRIEARARQLTEAKDHFFADASHEIRTPLNAILGFSQMLARTPLDHRQREMLDGIQSAGDNLIHLLEDLLDASKMEAGMLRIESRPFSLREVLTGVERLFSLKMAEKRLAFRVEITPDTPDILLGDPARLTQVLANLVGNAVKFTRQGYVFLMAEQVSSYSDSTLENNFDQKIEKKTILRFLVKDTGPGIPPEQLAIIFERFRQMEDGTNRALGGVGLGLAIARELSKLMGGQISVESHLGFGTTFLVEIPFAVSAQSVPSVPEESPSAKNALVNRAFFPGKKILLVDDNPLNRKFAAMLLKENGCLTEEAETGEDALEKLRAEVFDAVLMDIQLPDMDGYTVTQAIRSELKNNLPIIALTGYAQVGEREKCISIGMDDYLQKPVSEAALQSALERFFAKKSIQPVDNEWVTKENILSLDYLLDLSKGRRAFVREMLDMFVSQAPKELADLKVAVENSNFNWVKTIAHNLRSTAAYVGMNPLGLAEIELMETAAAEPKPACFLKMQFERVSLVVEKAVLAAREADF